MVTLRLAKDVSDLEYISYLYGNSQNNQHLIRKELPVKDLEALMRSRNDYILEVADEKIGWFFIKKNADNSARFAIIIDFEFQGKGYGKEAMDLIEQEGKKLGVTKLILDVFAENEAARKLYEKSGYKEVANLIRMEKEIK